MTTQSVPPNRKPAPVELLSLGGITTRTAGSAAPSPTEGAGATPTTTGHSSTAREPAIQTSD